MNLVTKTLYLYLISLFVIYMHQDEIEKTYGPIKKGHFIILAALLYILVRVFNK